MGFMKFVIPFVGGAITAAAAAALAKKNREERDQNGVEIDAEFEEKLDSDNEQKADCFPAAGGENKKYLLCFSPPRSGGEKQNNYSNPHNLSNISAFKLLPCIIALNLTVALFSWIAIVFFLKRNYITRGSVTMDKFIITIARGFGSGGRTIGQMLSKKLGVDFYDKDIIKLASEDSGINEALFGQSDEQTKGGIGKRSVYKGGVISPDKKAFTSEENLFNYTAKVIKQLADEKSCIIVGRCADFVLRDRPDAVRVFVWADEENCVKNVAEVKGILDRKEALKTIAATDKKRAEYYRAHTGHDWNDARNYDLCLNSGDLGFEKCVEIITEYIKIKLK